MGFLDSLKVRNTLAGLFNPDPVQLNPNQMTPDQISAIGNQSPMSGDFQLENIRKLMEPHTVAQDQLTAQLGNQPNRTDYKPSLMTNILSRIGGLSASGPAGQANGQMIGYKGMGKEGQDMIQSGLNRGYNNAMADWNAKLKPLSELSDAERAQNTDNRLIGNTMLRDQNADQERERKTAKDTADNQLKRDKLDEQYYFAGIKEQALYQPNVVQFMDDNGKLYTLDKKSGDIKPTINPLTGEQMNGSKLPQAEQMKLKQNNDLALVAARGSQTRQNITAQGAKEVDVAAKTLPGKEELKGTTPGKNTAPVEGSGSGKSGKTKVGDQKVFPNGKIGQWDGQGWKDTGKVAK